ncbi:protein fem-1 homolog B-like [Pocillopora verrucosa]|uniref:protein fem-1 homolog B-like n=1 Tax=Pocillopora verrucosa TaxID=203993 RepID=UPI00333F6C6A
MGNKASIRGVVTTAYQADHDDSSDLFDLVRYLSAESRKAALETKMKDGDDLATPLIIAARDGKLDFVKVLLCYEANIEARGTIKIDGKVIEGCTALWIAASNGHFDVVRLLIEQNSEVDGRTSSNSTPLRSAAFDGRLDIVSYLVEGGADVNARNFYNSTPLIVTCCKGHQDVASFLVKHGANVNLQDNKGNSCLHYASKQGRVLLVCELLALGANQTQNLNRLTPLLEASNDCKIEMVEWFISRPECSKEERIDALELLGATIANDSKAYDIEKAFSFMKRGMEERYEDTSCTLFKKKMEPVEAYQNRTESQTLEELSLLEGDDHAIQIEGLMIRERIFGTDNTILRNPIHYRGAAAADCKKYELCIGLWTRAMEIGMNCNVPETEDIEDLTDLVALMIQNGHSSSPQTIENIFEKLIDIKRKLSEKLKSGELEEEPKNKAQETLLFNALYLLVMYTKVQVSSEMKNGNMIDLLQRFLCLEPRTRDGNTLLHLAAWHKTPVPRDTVANWRGVCELPCVETMKLILHAGCDVNSVNAQGNTPLHLVVTFAPGPEQVESLKEMLELLLDLGADTKLVDKNGQTVMDCCETEDAPHKIFTVV